jgi:hypothetical protein
VLRVYLQHGHLPTFTRSLYAHLNSYASWPAAHSILQPFIRYLPIATMYNYPSIPSIPFLCSYFVVCRHVRCRFHIQPLSVRSILRPCPAPTLARCLGLKNGPFPCFLHASLSLSLSSMLNIVFCSAGVAMLTVGSFHDYAMLLYRARLMIAIAVAQERPRSLRMVRSTKLSYERNAQNPPWSRRIRSPIC